MRPATWLPLLACALAPTLAAGAQVHPAVAERKAAMQRLAPWVGEWKGRGWTVTPSGERQEFTVEEKIQSRLGGLLLLVEGLGRRRDDAGLETIGHDALALVSYDERRKQYRFHYHTFQGADGESELKLLDGRYEWGFKPEGAPVTLRFTIRMEGNRWNEVGDLSTDGQTWRRFFEMNLERATR